MNLPIDVVVDLLMQNAYRTMIGWGHCLVEENQPTQDDLRSKVREYLETLAKENANVAD